MTKKIKNAANWLKNKLLGKMETTLDHSSQDHALRYRMQVCTREGLTHDQTVIADIGPIRLNSIEYAGGKSVMRFCPVEFIHVKKVIQNGDGGELPKQAVLKGFKSIPKSLQGELVVLRDVKLHSNGQIQVIATKDTVFEKY